MCFDRPVYRQIVDEGETGNLFRMNSYGSWIIQPDFSQGQNLTFDHCDQKALALFFQWNQAGTHVPTDGHVSQWIHTGNQYFDYHADNVTIFDEVYISDLEEVPEVKGGGSFFSASWCCKSNKVTFGEVHLPDEIQKSQKTFKAPVTATYRVYLTSEIDQLKDGFFDSMSVVTPYEVIPVPKVFGDTQEVATVCLKENEIIYFELNGQSPQGEFHSDFYAQITWSTHDHVSCLRTYEDVTEDDSETHLDQLEKAKLKLGQTKLADTKQNRINFAINQLEDIWKQ